jgi:hypothetical protein
MAGRGGIHQSLASRSTAAQASHIGLGAGLVEEDQASEVYLARSLSPGLTLFYDVGAILLAGVERLFLKRRSNRTNAL